jgi:DNA polymerase/3'-5' exonuclease PolX
MNPARTHSVSEKMRYQRTDAMFVANAMCRALRPVCDRIQIAGSLRRERPSVGDIEILYVPRFQPVQIDFFNIRQVNMADTVIKTLLECGIIDRRLNAKGQEMWGEKNKLARHIATGIPVDLFAADEENWWNYLVCRTGPAESNIRVAAAAKAMGWRWNPYGPGFSRGGVLAGQTELRQMDSEEDVFRFVNLPYVEPCQRR